MAKKKEKAEEHPLTAEHVPFITATLDTSGEGWGAISGQMQATVDYYNDNHVSPAVIEDMPDNAVSDLNARGLSVDNDAPLDEDNVAGDSLSDGFKDPMDHIEDPAVTDVTPEDASGISDANERGKSEEKSDKKK
jgi:hypothetical protein